MAPPPTALSATTPTVLLVDDVPANLVALEAVLEALPMRCLRASSGTEALRLLLKEDVALILLDVQMPGLDGFETARLIRGRERTRHVPIIFVTAISREEEHILRGYAEGAIDYLVKPFHPDVLRAKVAALLEVASREAYAREAVRAAQARAARAELALVERLREERDWLQSLFAHAPFPLAVTRGPEHVVALANPRFRELVGGRSLVGRPAAQAIPELVAAGHLELLDRAYTTGEPLVRHAQAVTFEHHGRREEGLFDIVLQPIREVGGTLQGVMVCGLERARGAQTR